MKPFCRLFANFPLLVAVGVGGLAAMPAYAGPTAGQTLTRTLDIASATSVSVENLVGRMKVSQGGKQLEVTAHVVAGGTSLAAAQALTKLVKLEVSRNGPHLEVQVSYPVGQYDRFVYQRVGDHKTDRKENCLFGFLCGNSSSSITYQGTDVRVFRGRGKGVRLYVDVDVKVPANMDSVMTNHVGTLTASDLNDNLSLHGDDGDVKVRHLSGQLAVDTGSGDVRLADLQGAVIVHTGSGDVNASRIKGSINIHTGSGDIEGGTINGATLETKTGSGDVTLNELSGALNVRSGSGDIRLTDVTAHAGTTIITGSGDITLSGNLSEMKDFELGAGSGDIRLATKQPPEVHLDINTGSGDIEMHWRNVDHIERSDHSFAGDIGAAISLGRIHTGSGDVVLQD